MPIACLLATVLVVVGFAAELDEQRLRTDSERYAQNLESLGQPLQARDLYVESLSLKRELGDRRGMAITLTALARLAPAVGEPGAAAARLMESLAVMVVR